MNFFFSSTNSPEKHSMVDIWNPPKFAPEEISCLIDIVNTCVKSGLLSIAQYEIVVPLYKKMTLSVQKENEEFEVIEQMRSSNEKPETEEDNTSFEGEEENEESKQTTESDLTTKKKKKKKKRRKNS